MKTKFYCLFLIAFFCLSYAGILNATPFIPVQSQKYYLIQKATGFGIGTKISGTNTVPALTLPVINNESQQFEFISNGVTNQYYLKSSAGYIYWSSYSTYYKTDTAASSSSSGYLYELKYSGTDSSYCYLYPVYKSSSNRLGTDGTTVTSSLYSNKGTNDKSAWKPSVSDSVNFVTSYTLSETNRADIEIGFKPYPLSISGVNAKDTLILKTSAGFTVSIDYITAAAINTGTAIDFTVNVSDAAAGDTGRLYLAYIQGTDTVPFDSLKLRAVEQYKRYYIVNDLSKLVLGTQDTDPTIPYLLTKAANDSRQYFILKPVNPGAGDSIYNLVQDVDYQYFSKYTTSSYDTYMGELQNGNWKLVQVSGDSVAFMNTTNSKYLAPDDTISGIRIYADKALTNNSKAIWRLEEVKAFEPVQGEYYYIEQKATGFVIGASTSGTTISPVLAEPEKLRASSQTFRLDTVAGEPGVYYMVNPNNEYLYYSSYSTYFQSYDETATGTNKGYKVNLTKSETLNYFTINTTSFSDGSYGLGTDATDESSNIYADKKASSIGESALWCFKQAGDIDFVQSIVVADTIYIPATTTETVSIKAINIEDSVVLTASDGFTLSDSLYIPSLTSLNLKITASDSVGLIGTLTLTAGTFTKTAVLVTVKDYDRYYIIHNATGLALGTATTDVWPKVQTPEEGNTYQQFILKQVDTENNTYNIIQDEGDRYMYKQTSSGWNVNFGTVDEVQQGEWVIASTSDGLYTIKNLNGGYFGPNSSSLNATCYTDKSSSNTWRLIKASDMPWGIPTFYFTSKNMVMDKTGVNFQTYVRIENTTETVTLIAPEGFTVSPATITPSLTKQKITVTPSASVGTTSYIYLQVGGVSYDSIKVSVVEELDRYYIQQSTSGLLVSVNDGATQPILQTKNTSNAAQKMVLLPVDASKSYYNILTTGSYSYLSKITSSSWNTTFGELDQGIWEILQTGDSCTIRNTEASYLGFDSNTEGSSLYTNKGTTYWKLILAGSIVTDKSSVKLPHKDSCATIQVTGKGLTDSIAITASEGFEVTPSWLAADTANATITISSANGSVTSGTITLLSGDVSKVITVSIKTPTLTVSKDSVTVTGKNGSASFTITGTDIDSTVYVTAPEGFKVSVSTISGAETISQSVAVSYTGKVSATGLIAITSDTITRQVFVSAVISPAIKVSKTQIALEGKGSKTTFIVTATDLFEKIQLTATEGLTLSVDTLAMNAKNTIVTVEFTGDVSITDGTITLTSDTVTSVIAVTATIISGIDKASSSSVKTWVRNGYLFIDGIERGSAISVYTAAGKLVRSDVGSLINGSMKLPEKGVYLIQITNDDSIERFKIAY